jgi:hypothetical protein
MTSPSTTRLGLVAAFLLASVAWLSADILTLRDGRRVTGELVGVRNGVIEFQERGSFSSRILRIPRDEVRQIELDEYVGERPAPERHEAGRPGGMREREVVVSGDVPWNDTGVEVRAGQVVYLVARGTVWWGPGRKDGPEGEKNSPHNPGRPIPNRPAAALIGKIGNSSSDFFFIGDEQGPIRMRASGRLYLGVNDDVLRDNRGNFRVVVSY